MSGGGKSPTKGSKPKSKSRSEKAGLIFPVGRIERNLKYGRFANRIGNGAPIFMAAVLEYLTAEVLEVASNMAQKHGRQRIIPRFVQLAVRADEELSRFLGNVIIAAGGIHSEDANVSKTPRANATKKKVTKKAHTSDDEDEPIEEEDDALSEDAGVEHNQSQEYI